MADLDEREEPPSRQSRPDKSKRASGESSIYRDEDGSAARVRLDGEEGERPTRPAACLGGQAR
jgi:hypothetical protein